MTYTIRDAFNRLKKIEDAIPLGECIWLVSIGNPANRQVGGRITTATRAIAARSIDDGTHRLATDEEQAAHEALQQQERDKARYARIMPKVSYRGECIVLEPKAAGEEPKKKTGR